MSSARLSIDARAWREVEAFFGARGLAVEGLAFADAWRAKYQPARAAIRGGGRGYVALDSLRLLDVLLSKGLDRLLPDRSNWPL